ncbi:MAG: hypothetical protein JNK76_26535, partial [Planctomycetales bacterium]|nr:hypothetical protein [Planctomycetales bacterium]
NLLDPQGTVVGPDLVPRPIQLEQTAPGRYAADFETEQIGSYFLVVRPGPNQPTLRAGVNVSYSPELRDREPNLAMLVGLAALRPEGAGSGMVASALSTAPEAATSVDFFRHDLPPSSGRRDLWPELLLAALLVFVFDVFLRRVAFDAKMLLVPFVAARDWWRSRSGGLVPATQTMDRLKSRKQEVVEQVRQRATVAVPQARVAAPKPIAERTVVKSAEASRSFAPAQPQADAEADADPKSARSEQIASSQTPPSPKPPAVSQEAGYTSRLLEAKRRAMQERRNNASLRPDAPSDKPDSEPPPKDTA